MRTALAALLLVLAGCATAPPPTVQVEHPRALPIALDPAFSIRKVKLYELSNRLPPARQNQDASISFERVYRLYGAVTALDGRQRYGNYFDFFWRARREADVTVRFEYQQEKLHAFTQAREVRYPHVRGNQKTEFAVLGDDFFDDGAVIAWRASLIVNGRIVAVHRSYLWPETHS